MFILGVTGGSGGGKTTLLIQASKRGALVLDCDEIYHTLLQTSPKMLTEIDCRFPNTVIDGVLDRKQLGRLVFADESALHDLNAITHRYVTERVTALLQENADRPLAVIDAIGLIESGLSRMCDATVAVTAPMEQRICRLMAREGIDRDYATSRILAQKPDSFYIENCTDTLNNDYASIEAFAAAADAYLDRIMEQYKAKE